MSLTNCASCGAQYNTANMAPNQQFQCSQCGNVVTVMAQQAPAPRAPGAAPGGRRPMGAAPGRRAPGGMGAPQGYAQPGYPPQGQPGYGQQGDWGQPQMPMAPKKSNSGVIIGVVIGVVVLGLIILILATSSGGAGGVPQADLDAMAAKIRGWDYNNRAGEIREEDLKKADEYLRKELFEDKDLNELRQRYTRAYSAFKTFHTNELTKKINAAKADARKEVTKVVEEVYTAMMDGDYKKIVPLIDFDQMVQNTKGQGVCITEGKEKPSPLTHNYKFVHKEGEEDDEKKVTIDFVSIRTRQEMTDQQEGKTDKTPIPAGLQLFFDFYSNSPEAKFYVSTDQRVTETTYEMRKDNDEAQDWDLYGSPKSLDPESPVASDHYYSIMYIKTKGGSYKPKKTAQIYIGGEWGDPAKILWIWAPFGPEVLRFYRDERFYDDKEGYIDGDGNRIIDKNDPDRLAKEEAKQALIIDFLNTDSYKADADFGFYGIKPSTALREVLDHVNGGADATGSQIELLQNASDDDKLKTLAAIADLLVKAHKIGGTKADAAVASLTEFGSKGLKDWQYLNKFWVDDLFYRRMFNAHEMAFRYRQCYDKVKMKIAETAHKK